MSVEQKLQQESFEAITEKLEAAERTIKSAKECLADGDFFQAAVRAGSLSHTFTETEMVFFEVLSHIPEEG